MRRVLRGVLLAAGGGLAAALLTGTLAAMHVASDGPRPLDALLDAESHRLAERYASSRVADEADPQAPEVLVLGTSHYAQVDHDFADHAFEQVADGLAGFDPDVVAVEQLPRDWEPGRGRDYRPDLDLDALAADLGVDPDRAERVAAGLEDGADVTADHALDPCEVADHLLVAHDLTNAVMWWDRHGCDGWDDETLAAWVEGHLASEHQLIGAAVAGRVGLDRLAPMDFQGDERDGERADWFLPQQAPGLLLRGRPGEAWEATPWGLTGRQLRAHTERHGDGLADELAWSNSPEHLALQHWAYEVHTPATVTADDLGARQTAAFWRRNEAMAERTVEEAERAGADRVLVITGSGHKYFLDELFVEAGWRWVDPRDHLPEP